MEAPLDMYAKVFIDYELDKEKYMDDAVKTSFNEDSERIIKNVSEIVWNKFKQNNPYSDYSSPNVLANAIRTQLLAVKQPIENFEGYVYKTGHNLCLDELRKNRIQLNNFVKDDIDNLHLAVEGNQQMKVEIKDAFNKLRSHDSETYQVCVLSYIERASIKEICELLSITLGEYSYRKRQGKVFLKELLK